MNKIDKILTDSIKALIDHSSSPEKIRSLQEKHNEKLHFIPYRYRVFGGVLQSMNIQFGNFIEKVMDEVISENPNNEIIRAFSGKRNNKFCLNRDVDVLIDTYISSCQVNNYSDDTLRQKYNELISEIDSKVADTSSGVSYFKHDVDVLFRDKTTDIYYYVEIKYNDDHDTGKFVDINRKVLKTYAYLKRELGEQKTLKPILYYFNNRKKKGNIYIPEGQVIYRGGRFFEEFTNIKYEELDAYMKTISEAPETIQAFQDLYNKIIFE